MTNIKEYIIKFIKRETIFCVALICALITMLWVSPSLAYLEYIDFRVLALLFCLMLVIAGFNSVGVFEKILPALFKLAGNSRQLFAVLILVCFFLSMWVTNDVALITLVPFTIMILNRIELNDYLIKVIVMQTVAANLGSMCTPIGNPQNLYLYTVSGMSPWEFIMLMLPLSLGALILICITIMLFPAKSLQIEHEAFRSKDNNNRYKTRTVIYLLLLGVCLLTILRIVDYKLTFVIVVAMIIIVDRRLLFRADYMLLLTFVSFFVFVGNLKNIDAISDFLNNVVRNNEVIVSVIASQVISNVPAAVLLSGFTNDTSSLMIGTNLGGLGTLIASMASLISFKYYTYTPNADKKRYLFLFTVVNIIYIVILLLGYMLFSIA